MPSREKLDALVLSRRNVGEADRLVTFFTRSHGLVRALAKGVRKIPSRRGGHLEPFSLVTTIISFSRAGSYLSTAETIDYFSELHEQPDSFACARNMAMVVVGLFEEGQIHASLFDAICEAWRYLPTLDASKQAMMEVAVVLHALREGGLMPDLGACGVCGASKPVEAIVLDASVGGWKCLSCHGKFEDAHMSLAPELLKVLRFLHVYPGRAMSLSLEYDKSQQVLTAVRYYISYVLEKPLFISPSYAG